LIRTAEVNFPIEITYDEKKFSFQVMRFGSPKRSGFHQYPENVKTPAVKPCIVYIIDLPDSVGSKELSA